MNSFKFGIPSLIYYGRDCVTKNGDVFHQFGKKAYIVTSKFFPGCKNKALEDIKEVLKAQGICFTVNDNVIENPPVKSCIEMAKEVKDYAPDFLIGVGGGSTMDTVKGLNIILKYPDCDPYEKMFDPSLPVHDVGGPDHGLLPMIFVPTTAGTGAEITGVAVLTREDIDNKAGTRLRTHAKVVFIDAQYVAGAPAKLNQSVAIDALAHGLEPYLSVGSCDNFMSCAISEIGFKLFAEFKDALLADTMTLDDYDKQLLACTLQGIAETQVLTGIPHGAGYPLSHYKNVPHGLACGVFIGEYLRMFKDQTRVNKAANMLGFENADAFADYVQAILAKHLDFTVTREEIEDWSNVLYNTEWRIARHPEPLTLDDIRGLYTRALATVIVD